MLRWLCVLALLSGCAASDPAPPNNPQPPTVSATGTPVPSPTLILEAGWESLTWEGITIHFPPNYAWNLQDATNPYPATRVSATLYYAGPQQPEAPAATRFSIITTELAPQAWIAERAAAAPLEVAQASIAPATIDGQPGLTFMPQVTGVGMAQNFVVQLTPGELLVINTDLTAPPMRQVVETLDLP